MTILAECLTEPAFELGRCVTLCQGGQSMAERAGPADTHRSAIVCAFTAAPASGATA